MAAKRTAELVPLCHPLSLTRVEVILEPDEKNLPFISGPRPRQKSERVSRWKH
ncbi:MAG: hypothetical protein Ct9H300mP16_12530 [Pseudomonadota bacterium]|nr:MAG: hypothetical protein Ct9H300mP16_12530 [Pseudomonadota bacterium]